MRKKLLKLAACLGVVWSLRLSAAILYVCPSNSVPVPPYATWATAATNLQLAVDAANPGDFVLVTNGLYQTGGRAVYEYMTNRVTITKPITVQSVNGAAATVIQGNQVVITGNGKGAVRCVWLGNGAVLNGFTLQNGATMTNADINLGESGGGVWCASTNAWVLNCVLSQNTSFYYGAGAYSGTLSNCLFSGNNAITMGGGCASNILLNCTLSGNTSASGGGAAYGILLAGCVVTNNRALAGAGVYVGSLTNCWVTANTATNGGGVYACTLSGCQVVGNTAKNAGGGATGSILTNCTVTANHANFNGGGADGGTFLNCTFTGNYATNGGAMDSATVVNCWLTGNAAANWGGAAYFSSLTNCLVVSNTASWGGGAYYGTLNNCTVAANTAGFGGGVVNATVNNAIVYNNTAPVGANSQGAQFTYSCTTPAATGPGNISAPPQWADSFRLSATSPCVAAGDPATVAGNDLLGAAWATPPAMGCAEFNPVAATGALSVAIQANYTNVAAGFPLVFSASVTGAASTNAWNFGDGTGVANSTYVTHTWAQTGTYQVVFWAANASQPGGVSTTQTVVVSPPAVYYVRASNVGALPPYATWATAATNIQDAVGLVTVPGSVVVVSNGVYNYQSAVVYGSMPNRVAVTVPLTLQSQNGPLVTFIQGKKASGATQGIGSTAVRAVYLADGARLNGFTITNSATHSTGDALREQSGGGIWCASAGVLVSNCVINWNVAAFYGGGAVSGTLTNCTLINNNAPVGGGVYGGSLNNCFLNGNSANSGGGAAYASLTGCQLNGNSAQAGGGANVCNLNNCLVTNNSANQVGGGACGGTLTNCLVLGNVSTNGGGAYAASLTNCTVAFNQAWTSGGGVNSGTLSGCLVVSNTAANSGAGAYGANLVNCTLADNTGAKSGGGANGGSLLNCTLAFNSAFNGGGAMAASLTICIINSNNIAGGGGGTYGCNLLNCSLTNNTAYYGGGVNGGSGVNCTLAGNTATGSTAGGASGGSFTNCTFIDNTCVTSGGGFYSATLVNCLVAGNRAQTGGGGYNGTLFNCWLTGNTAINSGGGACAGTLYNCDVTGNTAVAGGGLAGGTLYNCTVTGNAGVTGGGASGSTLYNCLVYYNGAATGANIDGGALNYCCTTPSPLAGVGNLTAAPLLADTYHLSAASPCRGAGSAAYASGSDLDGLGWNNPPDIGCAQYAAGLPPGTVPLSVALAADHPNAVPGFPLNFTATITGVATSNVWNFGDGTGAVNQPFVTHAWTNPGTYDVTVQVFNAAYPGGVSAALAVPIVVKPVYYVAAAGAHPVAPYNSWATAATNLQDAVNAATVPGALVLVTNGVYAHGGQVVFGALTNRLAVTLPLVVQSVNGPGVTVIQGSLAPGTTNGDSAVRAVYLTNGAALYGFTLTNGATRAAGDLWQEQSGAGVWCAGAGVVVSNCVVAGNAAYANGGGIFGGIALNSQFNGNTASQGGGAYDCYITNCLFSGNAALTQGGGAAGNGTLTGCTLAGNTAANGGGAASVPLNGCTLTNNAASDSGGGAYYSYLTNCLLLGNQGGSYAGGAYYSTLNQCLLASNFMSNVYGIGGGVYDGNLTNCVFIGNAAFEGGGAIGGTQGAIIGNDALVLVNCAFTNNTALVDGGGATCGQGGSMWCFNCTFVGNGVAGGSGGGAAGGTFGAMFTNCLFQGNSATTGGGVSGGVLYNCQILQNNGTNGGGANGSTLYNCVLTGNTAAAGGGADGCIAYNCTLTGNTAVNGGGDYGSTLYSSLVYANAASVNPNYLGSTMTYCCTTPLAAGSGNLAADPLLADAWHLSANSPCRGAGAAAYASGVDIDGEGWVTPPSIGADEYYATTATGPLTVGTGAVITRTVPGFSLGFSGIISGAASANTWSFGDGTVAANRLVATHAWNAPGAYSVVFTAFNNTHPGGISATVQVQIVSQPVHYVSGTGTRPVPPYATWATAATNLQDAVNAANVAGALVLVTNGLYQYGGEVVFGALTNRLAVTLPLVVKSVNGPAVTWIAGNPELGDPAVRCVYLTNGASLLGFTLTNGATRVAGDSDREQGGGGIWCDGLSVVISNCLVIACSSGADANGFGGAWYNCAITGGYGDGADYASLSNCQVTSQTGNGVDNSTLNNCSILTNNGDGTVNSLQTNCTVAGNAGIGVNGGTAVGCTLQGNNGNGAASALVLNSLLKNNGGGATDSTLYNCCLTGNYYVLWGGANNCTLVNCTVVSNSSLIFAGGINGCKCTNCILFDNVVTGNESGGIFTSNFNSSTMSWCCTYPLAPGGPANLTNDPAFVNSNGGDFHLQTNSLCINAGKNTYATGLTDLDGNPRIAGGTVDLGAYELPKPASIIAYAWLQQYGLATDGSADYVDTDHTGMANWQKWIAGLNPTNPASVFKISSFQPGSAGPTVSWYSVPGITYSVQRSGNPFGPPVYTTIQSNLAGQSGTTSYQDTNNPATGPYLYRVAVRP